MSFRLYFLQNSSAPLRIFCWNPLTLPSPPKGGEEKGEGEIALIWTRVQVFANFSASSTVSNFTGLHCPINFANCAFFSSGALLTSLKTTSETYISYKFFWTESKNSLVISLFSGASSAKKKFQTDVKNLQMKSSPSKPR